MSLKARKAAHREFRDKLRERKRLRKERREEQQRDPRSRPPGPPPKSIPGQERIARPTPDQVRAALEPSDADVKVALEEVTATLIAAEECMVLARRRKRGKDETVRIYVKHMKDRGYPEDEARLALQAGEAARRD